MSPNAPARTARHDATRSSPRLRAAIRSPDRAHHDGQGEEPHEHAADVAHVAPFSFIQHWCAADRRVEVRRPQDQVGQDRIGRLPQVRLREPRPHGSLGTTLLERHPHGVEEERDRQRHDGETDRECDPDVADPAQGRAHPGIVARSGRYSSSRVLACSHQPDTVMSSGGSRFSSVAARWIRSPNASSDRPRMSRRPSTSAWIINW